VTKGNTADLFQPAPLPTAKLGPEETLACLRLIRSEGIGPVTFRDLINHYGGAQNAISALPEIARRAGRAKPIKLCTTEEAEAELSAAERAGATPIFTIEPGYPAAVAAIDAPPPLLYVKGRIDLLNRPCVGIVGSRVCSAAGAKLAGLFARQIGEAGYVIASGLARGIDGAAHQASLASGTVAVLAGGIDKIYPPEHAKLYAHIAAEGCLVTERPPGIVAREKDFPRRNRIIAALSLGVIVIEAAARSGTLVTARYANEQGREVFAVPGHPLDPRAEGTNRLIKNGATLVTTAEDVLDALRPISGLEDRPAFADFAAPALTDIRSPPPEVDDNARSTVIAALGPAPIDIDAIQRATGLSVREVQIALMELDLAGRLERTGHGLVALKGSQPN
jgi:DNA processing protein